MTQVIDTNTAKERLAYNVKRILAEREAEGLPNSRYWLARKLGVTDQRIKLICDGVNDPAWSFAQNLAEALSLDGFRTVTDEEFKIPLPKSVSLTQSVEPPKPRRRRKLQKVG